MTGAGSKKRGGIVRYVLTAAVFVIIIVFFITALNDVAESNARRQEESLIRAIDRSISYCYAAEGSYPESLDYICEHYGLTYDKDRFFVDYRLNGGNILPDYTVIRIG